VLSLTNLILGVRLTKLRKTHSGKYVKKMMEECSYNRKVGAHYCELCGSQSKVGTWALFESLETDQIQKDLPAPGWRTLKNPILRHHLSSYFES
jgi:hypothetical protein